MPDLDLETARLAKAGVDRIMNAGDRGATQVTTAEAVAMAKTIVILVTHIDRPELRLLHETTTGETP